MGLYRFILLIMYVLQISNQHHQILRTLNKWTMTTPLFQIKTWTKITKDERLNEIFKWSLKIHPFMFVLWTRNKYHHGLKMWFPFIIILWCHSSIDGSNQQRIQNSPKLSLQPTSSYSCESNKCKNFEMLTIVLVQGRLLIPNVYITTWIELIMFPIFIIRDSFMGMKTILVCQFCLQFIVVFIINSDNIMPNNWPYIHISLSMIGNWIWLKSKKTTFILGFYFNFKSKG